MKKSFAASFVALVLAFGSMIYVGTVPWGAVQASSALPLPALATSGPPTLISMEGGRVAHSSTFQSQIVGDTFPHGLAGYQIRVSTGDPSIAVAFTFNTPDFGLTEATSTATSVSMGVADLNGVVVIGAVGAVLGTVTFLGKSEGVTPIVIDVVRLDDASGAPILSSTAVGPVASVELPVDRVHVALDG